MTLSRQRGYIFLPFCCFYVNGRLYGSFPSGLKVLLRGRRGRGGRWDTSIGIMTNNAQVKRARRPSTVVRELSCVPGEQSYNPNHWALLYGTSSQSELYLVGTTYLVLLVVTGEHFSHHQTICNYYNEIQRTPLNHAKGHRAQAHPARGLLSYSCLLSKARVK